MSVRVFAPAKINLTLEVGRPRADGMHPLQSAVTFADIGDWVEAAPASELSLRIVGPFAEGLAADETNLVLRAARALSRAAGIKAGASLLLSKNLPVASGIGGGSSDAGAALKALRALWRLDIDDKGLYEIARQLGSDVPVCVSAAPAYMTGAGDVFAPMTAPELFGVLINPGVAMPTAAVYARFDEMGLGTRFAEKPAPIWRAPEAAFADIQALGNDLEAAARAIAPVLRDIDGRLGSDACVRAHGLSGSGATMFALTDDMPSAKLLSETLLRQHTDWWVQPARFASLDEREGPR